MTLSLQDRRLRQAHAEFERSARGLPNPARLVLGVARAMLAIARTAAAARTTSDPIALQPRVLTR